MFSNPNHVTPGFSGFGGKCGTFIHFIVDFLIEVESQECRNIGGATSELVHRDVTDRGVVGMVEEVHNIEHTEEPHVFGAADTVHDEIDSGFEDLNVPFSWVLELLVGFAEPVENLHNTEALHDTFAVLCLCKIREQTIGSSVFINTILKGVDELLFSCHPIGMGCVGGGAKVDLM
jgi:hypothetical protein